MSLPTILTILGIIFILIGTVIAALPAIAAPPFLTLKSWEWGHKDVIELTYKANLMGYDHVDEKTRETAFTDAEEKRKDRLENLARKIDSVTLQQKTKAVRYHTVAITFVALGSVLQGVAALIPQ